MLSLSLFDYNMDDVIAARDSPIYFSDITTSETRNSPPRVAAVLSGDTQVTRHSERQALDRCYLSLKWIASVEGRPGRNQDFVLPSASHGFEIAIAPFLRQARDRPFPWPHAVWYS